MINVVYIAHDTRVYGGSALSLIDMISALRGEVRPLVICREEGPIADRLRAMGVEVIVYCYAMPVRDPYDRRYLLHLPKLLVWHYRQHRRDVKTLAKMLSGRGIDIVHSNNTVTVLGQDLARRIGARHVWHVREYLSLDHGIRIIGGYGWLRRRVRRSDAVVAISHSVYDFWGLKPANARVIGNAVRDAAQICLIPDKERYVLFCSGFLSERKGTLFAARAFLRAGLHEQGYTLRMFGKYAPQMAGALSSLAREAGAPECIELRGFCPDLDEQYRHAAAYIMASEHEALGRVTIEAMYCGCPVVARASGGTTDFVRDGDTGYLFTDLDGCAQALRRAVLAPDPGLPARAARLVAGRYSGQSLRPAMLDLYKSLKK